MVEEEWRDDVVRTVAEIFSSWEELDSYGRHINGTDKNGPNHSYGDAYERILTIPDARSDLGDIVRIKYPYSIREEVKLMMEVGIADGSSLQAWAEVFPHALCVGMDIHHSDKAHGERIEFVLGDQRSKADCERAAAGRMFDFIVEDATHILENNLLTLLFLWPFVKPGGLYVIEEFANVGALIPNIGALWPNAEVVGTCGPRGEDEPLVVFRKGLA